MDTHIVNVIAELRALRKRSGFRRLEIVAGMSAGRRDQGYCVTGDGSKVHVSDVPEPEPGTVTYETVISVTDWAGQVARRFAIVDGYATCGMPEHGDHPVENVPDFVQWSFEHWHCRDLDTVLDTFFRGRS